MSSGSLVAASFAKAQGRSDLLLQPGVHVVTSVVPSCIGAPLLTAGAVHYGNTFPDV
jgi:hypothetical protein